MPPLTGPTRLLDITRLVSRLGLGPMTGVDRVEAAYLAELSGRLDPLLLLCRTSYGYLLLPKEAGTLLLSWLSEETALPAKAGWIDRLRRRDTPRARAEAGLRAQALSRCSHSGLRATLARWMPAGGTYFNVGHSNLSQRHLAQLAGVPDLEIRVMIHDTIPLDYPQYCRADEARRFDHRFQNVLIYADVILCNSEATAADVSRHAEVLHSPLPRLVIAHLGITPPQPDPHTICPSRPYFVVLGTIEPRKNHALLLDVWEELARRLPETERPDLLILGRRGWNNDAVFARLDACPLSVHERAGISDAAVAALLARARGLLMPSHAEGYGLPMLEAAAVDCPVIACPLPATLELLGDYPVYLEPEDIYSWLETIISMSRPETTGPDAKNDEESGNRPRIVIPTWTEHFNLVLNQT
ncbi:glycosyltransferase [Phaeovulum sp. W22_SRMD_FR3]|uniref:glycosyltransferase n=1 Tax=Phaeovulum sp. W22_SRMD_FR3 TaxID=3240274 RepID=UPI003F98B51A